jgi:hypothetical protein
MPLSQHTPLMPLSGCAINAVQGNARPTPTLMPVHVFKHWYPFLWLPQRNCHDGVLQQYVSKSASAPF